MSSPEAAGVERWRVFPWDRHAAPGARFSPSYVPSTTGRGRFDLPRALSDVLYLADSPDHAVGETIQPWRGQRIGLPHLSRAGFPLALVKVTLSQKLLSSLFDLCDPQALVAADISPDVTASRHRGNTQPLARQIWMAGASGLRWWSGFWGDWHTTVLFTARTDGHLEFGDPIPLTPAHQGVVGAADLLGISITA